MSRKINLTAVTARPSLFEEAKEVNLARDLGNYIHFHASTIPDMRFGDRLFDAAGEIEVTDQEIKLIRDAIPSLLAWAQEAALKVIGE